ncbi:M23 family metallopeptidase [Staphylococcus agnetis]|uniref:lysostaphin n=1 Tax=Staphylococcus agnetis TaxID=985762 RepID=A0AAW9YUB9_9STAP|nr:M23 family metallopeptidase [Staphylococcus agnetis]NJI02786.1 peptidoglycan DD-metalloendopeptidase family protein [Staphylococcus agnetis]
MKKLMRIVFSALIVTTITLLVIIYHSLVQQFIQDIQNNTSITHIFHQDRETHGFGTYANGLKFNGDNRHYGIDYHLPENTDILAATDGTVTRTFKNQFGGNVLEIQESNKRYYQWYMHLNTFKVKPGDVVKAQDVIAQSGNTGKQTTGPHLHFQRMKDGIGNRYAENPAAFIESLPHGQRSLYRLK